MTIETVVRSTWLAYGLLLVLTACEPVSGGSPQPIEQPRPSVAVAEVNPRSLTEWDVFTGRLEAPESVALRARVSGYLSEVAFKEGDLVEQGEQLFQIDDRTFRAEVARLEAELESARSREALADAESRRADNLIKKGAISAEARDQRKSAYRSARADVQAVSARLDHARLQLEFTRVTAPISGRVSRANITEGNYVTAGESVLTSIVSTGEIYAYFDADEQTYLKYARMARSGERPDSRHVPTPVYLALAGEDDFQHEGYIDFIDNQVDPATGTIRGRAVIPNRDGLLVAGLFARVMLTGSGSYQGILINEKAVGTDLDTRYVLVVDENNAVQYRAVELGERMAGLRIVTRGLSAGDRVIVNGLQRVVPGTVVDTNTVSMISEAQQAELLALEKRANSRSTEQLLAESVAVPEGAGWTTYHWGS